MSDKQMDITDMNPELRRSKNVETYMQAAGDYVDVNDAFRVWDSINRGLHMAGLDRSLKIPIYNRYAHQTADKGRMKEKEVVQLLTQPAVQIIPGAGIPGPEAQDKVSLIRRGINLVRGKKGEGESE